MGRGGFTPRGSSSTAEQPPVLPAGQARHYPKGIAMEPETAPPQTKPSFWRIAGLTLLTLVAVSALLVTLAYAAGTVDVKVHEKQADGTRLHLILPAGLITWGVRLTPASELSKADKELRPWLPAIRVASRELARCPDATLVDVRDRKETVRIAKRGDYLVIDVDDAEDTVHVSLPLSTVAAVADALQPTGPPV